MLEQNFEDDPSPRLKKFPRTSLMTGIARVDIDKDQFELYKAKSEDKTYMGNLNRMDKFSFSLIISSKPSENAKNIPILQSINEDSGQFDDHLDSDRS